MRTPLALAVDRHGFAVAPAAVPACALDEIATAVAALGGGDSRFHAARHLLSRCEAVREMAHSLALVGLAREVLGENAFPVKATWFDKTPAANWRVAWHQDRIIAVREPREIVGFSCWTVKDGVPHVQPPREVLEQMVALRLHLDDCPASNGALRVLRSSHQDGFLSAEAIRTWAEREAAITVEARVGDVLLLRPLLLHASSSATTPGRRRVLHLEYAAAPLPDGLEWAYEQRNT